MRVVIVGGTGNISTSIVNLLVGQGHEVTCFNRGISDVLPEDVRLIRGDRNDREAFEKAMRREKFDAAIDMISFTPEDAASSLKAFRGVKHFIHCSTVVTYGVEFKWLPVTEDHPVRPTIPYGKMKVAADNLLLEAYYRENFPVTILKPSTTYGPKRVLRQLGLDTMWIDRIRKGKPILMLGDGKALHHLLYVDDAALGFAGALGKEHCIGQIYNIVNPEYTDWESYHRTAMKVLDEEVELVGVPLNSLLTYDEKRFAMCRDIFAQNCYYSSEKILRDIPEFRPAVSLAEGLKRSFEFLDKQGLIPNSDDETWEDEIIDAQRRVGMVNI
jgi:nucleoside-diphosphate-sugar epimerase